MSGHFSLAITKDDLFNNRVVTMANKENSKRQKDKTAKKSKSKKVGKLIKVKRLPDSDLDQDEEMELYFPFEKLKTKDWLMLKTSINEYCSKNKYKKTWQKLEKIFLALESAIDIEDSSMEEKTLNQLIIFVDKRFDKFSNLIDEMPKLLEGQMEAKITEAKKRFRESQKTKNIEVKAFVKDSFTSKYKALKKSKGFRNHGEFVSYLLKLIE